MANLLERQNQNGIRGRLRERARSTVTGGLMVQDDDNLSRYLPSNEIKADTQVPSSSPSQDARAISVSLYPDEPSSGEPNIQSPAGVVADDTDQNTQDVLDLLSQAQRKIDAGQKENILSPLDPDKINAMASSTLEQDATNDIKDESFADANKSTNAFQVLPHVSVIDPRLDTAESAEIKKSQRFKPVTPSLGRIASTGVLLAASLPKVLGASNTILDPIFSFVNDMQSIRANSILGDLIRINTPIANQVDVVEKYLEAMQNIPIYRKSLSENYDKLDPDNLSDIQMQLMEAEDFVNNNKENALQSLRDLYDSAREARIDASKPNPMSPYVDYRLSRDERGIATGTAAHIKNLDGLRGYLVDVRNRNDEDAAKRMEEYRNEANLLHNVNEIYRVSDEYNKQRQDTEFEWTNLNSWYYHVPGTMGSSAATIGATTAQFLTSAAAHIATRVLPTTAATGGVAAAPALLSAIIVGGVSAWTNYISRAQESGAEIYDAYKSNIYAQVEDGRIDLPPLLLEGATQLEALNVDVSTMNDEQLLDEMLASGIRTSNPDFNRITRESIVGLDQIWQQNMALGALDMAESVLIIPGVGKALSTGAKALSPQLLRTAATEASGAIAEQSSKLLTKTAYGIAKAMPKIAKVTETGVERFITKGLKPAAKIGLTMASEATEEGVQFMAGYNYAKGEINKKPNFIGSFLEMPVLGLNAWRGILGIHSDDALNDDSELSQSMKLGAVLGLVMGGGASVAPSPGRRGMVLEYADAIAGSKVARKMTAEHISAKEDMANIKEYTKKAMRTPDAQEYYLKQMEEAKRLLGPNSLLTTADVDTEITRTKRAFTLVNDPYTETLRKKLKLKKGSEDYTTLVALRMRAQENYRNARNNYVAANAEYQKQFSSPEVNEALDSQGYTVESMFPSTEDVSDREARVKVARETAISIARVNSEIEFLTNFADGIDELNGTFDEINKRFGDGTLNINKDNVNNYLDEIYTLIQQRKEALNNFLDNVSTDEAREALRGLDMNSLLYGNTTNMAGVITSELALRDAEFRNKIYNDPVGTTPAKYGKKVIKNYGNQIKEDIATFNKVTEDNAVINELAIGAQHDELLGQTEEQTDVIESSDAPNEKERSFISRILKRSKDKVTAIPEPIPEAEPTVIPQAEYEIQRDKVLNAFADWFWLSKQDIVEEVFPGTKFTKKRRREQADVLINQLISDGVIRKEEDGRYSLRNESTEEVVTEPIVTPSTTEIVESTTPVSIVEPPVVTPRQRRPQVPPPSPEMAPPARGERRVAPKVVTPKVEQPITPPVKQYGEGNKVVTTERYQELSKRMKDKLNQLSAGVDPEIAMIGMEMAAYHIESGVRQFAAFANKMVSEFGPKIKPYLKSFYEGARFMPGMESYTNELDPHELVASFNIDDITGTAEVPVTSDDAPSIWDTVVQISDAPIVTATENAVVGADAIITPAEQMFNDVRALIEPMLNELVDQEITGISPTLDVQKDTLRVLTELRAKLYDPTEDTSWQNENNLEFLEWVDSEMEILQDAIESIENQGELEEPNLFTGMNAGFINTDPKSADLGNNPVIEEVVPVQSNVLSQEPGDGQSNVTGTQRTNALVEEIAELSEDVSADIFSTMIQLPEGTEIVAPQLPAETLPKERQEERAVQEILETLPSDEAQTLASELGIAGAPQVDILGLSVGTVFVSPFQKSMFSEQGYEHNSEYIKLINDPRGLDGADIFITVSEPGSRWAPTFRLQDRNTWNNASIYVHIHKDGKKYAGALRRIASMEDWHQKNGRPLTTAERDAQIALRTKIIEQYAKYGPDVKLKAIVNRSNGVFSTNRNPDGSVIFRPVKDVKGLNIPQDVSKLESDGLYFGIGRGIRQLQDIVTTEDKLPLPGKGGSGTIYVYPRRSDTPGGDLVPAQLRAARFSDDPQVVEYIHEALTNDMLENDLQSIKDKHGIAVNGADLLNLVINNGDHTKIEESERETLSFLVPKQFYYDQDTRAWHIGDNVWTKEQLRTPEVKDAFIDYVSNNYHFTTPLVEFWNPFSQAMQSEMEYFNKQHIKLSKYLEFDMQDTGVIVGTDGNVEIGPTDGLTMLQWQVKRGVLQSDLKDEVFTNVFMYVKDVEADVSNTQSNSVEIAQKEITPIEDKKTTSTNEDDALLNDLDRLFGAEMRIGNATDDTMTQRQMANQKKINTKKAVNWLNKTLGLTEDQVTVTNGVIRTLANGSRVYGVAMKDSIALSNESVSGTEYHEAWHRISLLTLTPAQRADLYRAARQEYSEDANLEDRLLEESLAERFREYMIDRKSIKYKIQKFFSAIKTFVQKMFGIATQPRSAVTQLFDKIARGDFKNYALDEASIKEFEDSYINGANFTVGPNNDYEPKNIPSLYDYYSTVKSLMSTAFVLSDVKSLQDLNKLDLDKLKRTLGAMQRKTTSSNRAAVLQEIIDQFDTVFKPEMLEEMRTLAVREIDNAEHVEQDDAAEVQKMQFHDKPSYWFSKKDNALAGAKFFIASQPISEFVYTEKDGVTTQSLRFSVNPLTGMYEFVDFDSSWNTILNNMYDVETYQDIVDKAVELGAREPFFQTLANRLKEISNRKDTTLETQLLQTLKSHKHNMFVMKYGIRPTKDGKNAQVYWDVDNSETERIAKAYPQAWSSAFYNSEFVDITDDGAKLNKEKIADVQKDYAKIVENVSKEALTDAEVNIEIANLVKILQRIGINIDVQTVDAMLADRSKYASTNRSVNLRNMLTAEVNGSLAYLIRDLINADQKEIIETRRTQKMKSISSIYTLASKDSFVNHAAKTFALVNPDPQELMVLGPNNNLLYPIAQHNYMSDAIRWYNRKNEDGTPGEALSILNRDVYATNSVIRRALNRVGKPLKLNTYTNFRSDLGGDKGRGYTDITPTEDYLSKMALTAAGHLIMPTMADKGTYHTITGIKTFDEPISTSLNLATNVIIERAPKEALRYMSKAFLDEFNTVTKYWKNKSIVEGDPTLAVKNYHTKDFGGMFRYFTEVYKRVNGEPVTVDLNSEIRKRNGNVESIMTFLQDVQSYMITDDVNGEDVINSIIRYAVEQELNTLEGFGVIKKSKDGLYSNVTPIGTREINGLDGARLAAIKGAFQYTDSLNEHYAIKSMTTNYTLNTIMSILEYEKVFSGDPAFFNNPEDKIKRLPSVLSTGDDLRTDWPVGHRLENRQTYTVTEFNDNEISDVQYDELLALTKAAYAAKNPDASEVEVNAYATKSVAGFGLDEKGRGQMNQTDATVLISTEMYKDLMEMLGEWSPEIENAFKILERKDVGWLSNPVLYHESLQAVTKPLKMAHFGFKELDRLGIRVPIFDKMALFPMFRIFSTGDMYQLYERMEGIGKYKDLPKLDMAKFTSAVKVGSMSPSNPYTDQTNSQVSDFGRLHTFTQEFKHLRRQLITDPHTEERQMLGSQVAKATLANLRLSDTYGDGIVREKLTGTQIRDHIYNSMNELSNKGRIRVEDMFTAEGQFSDEKFATELAKRAKTSGMSPELIDGLKFENGKFKLPLAASSDTKWIASTLNSLINDETININMPGGAFIQMSSFVTNSITVLKDSAVNGGQRLKIHNTEGNAKGSMDAVVSINLFSHILPNKGRGMDFIQQEQWLINHNIIGNGNEVGPVAIGYRIPTQGMSSISSLRVVDVLPATIGDTIVLPDGFTKLTGSDKYQCSIKIVLIAGNSYKNRTISSEAFQQIC